MILALIGVITISMIGCSKKEQAAWSKIEKDGSFTYACSGGYPPFNYIDEKDHSLVGFDVDIANALAKEMGVKAEGITTEWDGILGGLTSKRFDCIIGSMAVTDDRKKQVSFTSPYYYDGAQFFAPKSKGYTSIKDMKDGKVGVVTGTTFQEELAKYPNVSEVLQFTSDIENFMAVQNKYTDGLVTSRFVGLQAPKKYNLVPVGELLYSEDIAIAVRKEDKQFLDKLNEALAAIIKNGTYEEISNKYFGTNILNKE
ncbi:ABC transporter substrate-binding protein [Anaerosacchariphilus polymeriproducens]|uniref:ABC transporter substrate-binding protein n=2 Tax=Anaerosacchariphilus polymeriproducens TaxID=1812858 RepID=A0A371AYR7_9FIRM|nr:ABC transporter substrate-binding protein [Anaerosacchariphilus polymeriproducens]